MKQFVRNTVWMGVFAVAATALGQDAGLRPGGAGTAPGSGTHARSLALGDSSPAKRPEPCYVVIAVDVSANMETGGSTARGQTLRDEGQLLFLQLLPFLRSDLYLGVTHFADRVRYSLPSRDTGPLLLWGQAFLSESACRNLLKPVEAQTMARSDVAEGLSWAFDRIGAARRQYGPGPAKLILLSKGDPRDSTREMGRGRGPLLTAAQQFAEQHIQVYPILMDEGALRPGAAAARPTGGELAAAELLQSVALTTGGKAYRLAPDRGFVDILLDVFDLGTPLRGDLVVSPHDWAIVAVGSTLTSLAVTPVGRTEPQKMALDDSLEAAAGIRTRILSGSGQHVTVLRRPGTPDLVSRSWQGRWDFAVARETERAGLRFYRIPDCLLQLEMVPGLPWWLNEQVQVKARLLDRHQETRESPSALPVQSEQGWSVYLKASSEDGKISFAAHRGRWTLPGRAYESEPFVVRAPGLYKLAGELRHLVGEVNAPVLHFTGDVYVHPACVALEIVNAATNEVLREVPPTAGKLWINLQGGQEVYVRAAARGEFKVELRAGVVSLTPLAQAEWPLRRQDNGTLVTGPIRLAEQEERLTGSAEVDVRTFAGVRHLRLPPFEMSYTPAPVRVACTFADPRAALWVGELHRQPLKISAFPVFEPSLTDALGLFPETLAGIHMRTVDLKSGTTQVVGPDNRRLEKPQPGGYADRTVSATYFVESTVPIPPADKCEIDLSEVMPNLQGAVKTYAVVDPVAKGLFEWVVQQGGPAARQGPVSETLFCGEPVLFFAGWRPDQNVSAVRFEIPQPGAAESLFVDLPITPGSNKAQLEQPVPGLVPGQVLPVYVHVTMQPAPAEHPLEIKLKGGQFRAEDRRVVLEDLTIGNGTLADLPAYVWEPVEVPVQAIFRGYKPEDPGHNAALEQFKKSCVVTVTPRTGDAQSLTDAIEWTSMTAADGTAKTCTLKGHVTYTPESLGRAALELTVKAPSVRGATGSSAQRAYAHLLAKEPRLVMVVRRLKPGGDDLVFDSRTWIKDQNAGTPLTTRLSTRLRVDLQGLGGAGLDASRPWKATVRLLRRPAANASWQTAFSAAGELASNQPLVQEVQIGANGQYALEVVGQDPQSDRPTVYVRTPIIASIQPHEVQAAVAPPTWLTARVRQWPFEYLVTLHQDAADLSRLEALAFQFQLPGQSETWLDGASAPVGPQTGEARQLSVKGPRVLPTLVGLRDGVAHFRLSSQGLEVLQWECPNIRVVPPVLEGLALGGAAAETALAAAGGTSTLDGSTDLWVRPQFRAAPELEGQWAASETIVYLWRDAAEGPGNAPADVRLLERLQEQEEPGGTAPDIAIHRIENKTGSEAVQVLGRRAARGFWGWPRKAVDEQYALAAAVVYRPQGAADSAGASGALPAVVEYSDVYPIHLIAPWTVPSCWWPMAAVLLMAVVAMLLRGLVPSPSRLALDLRLEENVAIVEPVRLDNPVLVDLKETSLAQEVVLYARYLCGRWGNAGRNLAREAGRRADSRWGVFLGRLLEMVAAVVAPVWVLLRRSLYPRRWAWATVIPRLRDDTAPARTALLCVWTGLGARRGRAWSSQAGTLALPEEGQTGAIHLDLPYRIDSVDRTMRVTVRVRRMGAEERRTTAAN